MIFYPYFGLGTLASFPLSFSTAPIANNGLKDSEDDDCPTSSDPINEDNSISNNEEILKGMNCSTSEEHLHEDIRAYLATSVTKILNVTNYNCTLEDLALAWLGEIYGRGTDYDGTLKEHFDEANASHLEVSQANLSFTEDGDDFDFREELMFKPPLLQLVNGSDVKGFGCAFVGSERQIPNVACIFSLDP